jgi:hypothetical protein
MTKIMKLVSVGFLLGALFSATARANTWPAASCNEPDVAAALGHVAADGDTVTIPAGTCRWTTALTYNQVYSTSIIGAGSQTIVGGGDVTVIVDNFTTNSPLLGLNLSSSKTLRMSGLTFQGGSGGVKDAGMINIGGPGTVRLDHDHFNFQTYTTAPRSFIIEIGTGVIGVMDHSILDQSQTSTVLFINGSSDAGNTTWTQATGFGTNNFFFIEDNLVNGNATSTTIFEGRTGDCWTAGRYVVRFNTITETSGPEQHATGHSGDDRGCRAQEVYGNLFQQGAGQPTNGVNYDMADLGSGAALVWGNSAVNVFKNVFLTDVTRKDNTTYAQTAPPGGWGYCGTAFNGSGSNWDQNSVTSTGYACIDQPGRGAGDLLSYNSNGSGSGSFPQKCNLTLNPGCTIFTGQWPRQALEPIYLWNNNASPAGGWGGTFWSDGSGGRLTTNVDYYSAASGVQTSSSSPFNGTSGTGWGTSANRPSTCTKGVGYFATDQGTWNTSASNPYGVQQNGASGVLYQCSATNTWTTYYTPYTYPHPLQGGGGDPPSPPSNLQAVPQ